MKGVAKATARQSMDANEPMISPVVTYYNYSKFINDEIVRVKFYCRMNLIKKFHLREDCM